MGPSDGGYPWPLPELTAENTAFWTGGSVGELLIHRCRACGFWVHPPAPVCRRCHRVDVGPEPVSGTGVVHSFTVNHQPWLPGIEVPYTIAVVELDEQPGLWLTTRLVEPVLDGPVRDGIPAEVAIGARVRVWFDQAGDVWIPLFALTERSEVLR